MKWFIFFPQGLYEYVKPSWQKRARPNVGDYDVKTFGSTSPPRPKDPTLNPPLCNSGDKNHNLPRYPVCAGRHIWENSLELMKLFSMNEVNI